MGGQILPNHIRKISFNKVKKKFYLFFILLFLMLLRLKGFEDTKIALFMGGGQGDRPLNILEFPFLKVKFAIKKNLSTHRRNVRQKVKSQFEIRSGKAFN